MGKIYEIFKSALYSILKKADSFVYKYSQRRDWKNRYKGCYEKIKLKKSEKKEIDNYYQKRIGHKVPKFYWKIYKYIFGENSFCVGKIPPELYYSKIEPLFNKNKNYVEVFEDKNITWFLAKLAGIKYPKAFGSCSNNVYRIGNIGQILEKNEFISRLSNIGMCFIKPSVDSGQGKSCLIMNVQNGVDLNSGRPLEKILDMYNGNLLIQEVISQHPTLNSLNIASINTLRITTYIINNTIYHLPVILRIGRTGKFVDNVCAGGMAIMVYDNGELYDFAYNRKNEKLKEHPDSHILFKGYKIDGVSLCLDAAVRMHQIIPQIGYISWDLAIDSAGEPVLIEANMQECACWEYVVKESCFGEMTERILYEIAKE